MSSSSRFTVKMSEAVTNVSSKSGGEQQVQTSEGSGPHLEVLDRVCNIGLVNSAIEKTGSTYTYVKESSDLLSWALNYVESGLHYASATAAPIAAPIVKKFEGQISAVDQTLCKGFDIVESKVSSAKEQPQHVSIFVFGLIR